jgi:hypothetical protein
VVFTFLVFVAALAFCITLAMTLHTHNRWRADHTKSTRELADLQSDRDNMLYGNLAEVNQTSPSIRSVNAQLRRAEIDRGRVWRGCAKTQPPQADDTVVLNTVPAGIAPADAEPNRIEENSILYVFLEKPSTDVEGLPEGAKVPHLYIGEFTASAVADTSVTLKPTFPLGDIEKGLVRQPGVTWTLYETMPVDGHRFFAADPAAESNLKQPASEAPVFGQMDEEMLKRVMEPLRNLAGSDEVIQPYLLDGTPVDREFEDANPDRVWHKLSFKKAYKEPVDTAGDPLGVIKSSEVLFFDRAGQAEVALLRRGAEAEFKVGDWGLFPPGDAQRLIDEGYCDRQERVYVRPLNDYKGGLRSIQQQMATLALDINQAQRDTAEATKANQLVQEQIAFRRAEQDKINQDLEKFRYEQEQITQYAANLTNQWTQLRRDLSSLYASNSKLAEQLAQLDKQLTDDINRRSLEAADQIP